MKREADVYLQDILESINLIQEYVSDLSEAEFLQHRQIQDSIVRRFEIIGEAVKQIPDEFKAKHTDIPWRDIAGMRDILIHEYFGIKWKRIWDTIKNDLPAFKKQLEKIHGTKK